jgi:hypothetical protein
MSGSPDTVPAPPLRDERRLALVVATETYGDPSLRQLRAPARDIKDLTDVLADPEVGGFTVTSVIDKAAHEIRLAIEEFLDDRRTDDLLLVYLSCHGLVDPRRRLFFAASDTLKNRLAATGVEAQWLLDQLDDCRARRQVVILDCCFSGAFANTAKGDADLGLAERFNAAGRGRVVLTASRGSEYSFEGEPVPGSTMPGSIFTSALVDGIRSGAADMDKDGLISVDDAYGYAFDRLRSAEARQTPQRWLYGAEGDIFLARNPAGVRITPAPLPDGIRSGLDSPHVQIRLGAVAALGELLADSDPARALAARQALEQVTESDVPKVAEAARDLLGEPPASSEVGPGSIPDADSSVAAGREPERQSGPGSTVGDTGPVPWARRRRPLIIVAALAALAVIGTLVAIMLQNPTSPTTQAQNPSASASEGETPSLASGEIQAQAPWRLVVRDEGSNGVGCKVTLRLRDSDWTWTNEYLVYDDGSFQIPESGIFQWEAGSGCEVLRRSGPGSLSLPAIVGGAGTSDAFKPPASIVVKVRDFQGNSLCEPELRDIATGKIIDFRKLTKDMDTVTLHAEGSPLVYLYPDVCIVQVRAG